MEGFLNFVKNSPTAYHAAAEIEKKLLLNGFNKLSENQKWNLEYGGKYYIIRNGSAIMAFTIPERAKALAPSFNITAAHLDSPTFKLKPNFTIDQKRYLKLNTEVYGGPILNTWMDRPLNIAGRIIVKTASGLETKLISFDKAMAMIPNCSIHYYSELNKGVALNPQVDLLPLYCDTEIEKTDLLELIALQADVKKEDILSTDLFLALMDRGTIAGANDEFVMAPQIDNLECAYATLEAFLSASATKSINVLAEFDNEEIGSRTLQGAAGTLLADTLERITMALNMSHEEHLMALANSFIVSADNAQGFHPNYAAKYDPTNAVYMNSGIVIKNAARGSYTTDGVSQAYFKEVCKKAQAKFQLNTNRSDIPGGGTLGAISLGHVSIHSVDIGLPQIAMHSAYETAGAFDLEEMIKALTQFYEMHLSIDEDDKLTY